jgi:hypothetical protein
MTKMKNLAPTFARIARLDRVAQETYEKRDAELRRIAAEGRRVAWAAIKKAGWKRGETLLASRGAGWALGIYQGTSLPYPPMREGDKWSLQIHTLSVRSNGKPGKAKGVEWVSVDDPSMICEDYKIVGVISPAKVVHP